MKLSPTKTRLSLLRDVAAGEVHRYGDGLDYCNGWKRCTAAMELMERAGWVRRQSEPEPHAVPGAVWFAHKIPWVLTGDGERVLHGTEYREA